MWPTLSSLFSKLEKDSFTKYTVNKKRCFTVTKDSDGQRRDLQPSKCKLTNLLDFIKL